MTALEPHCMDVTCNRCGIVYEFEEALISTTGTTVKCTQCGHLFKVHRSAGPALAASDLLAEAPRWRVRRVDGSIHTLDSLADLTQLISVGQFAADDEISRTGQIWKRLGGVAELASLFERSQRPRRMSEPPLPPPPEPQFDQTPVSDELPRALQAEATVPGGKRRRRPTRDPLFHQPSPDSVRPPPDSARERNSGELPSPVPDAGTTAPYQPLPLSPSVASSPSVSAPPQVRTPVPSMLSVLDESPSAAREREGARTATVFIIGAALLLAGGIGAGLFLYQRGGSNTVTPGAVASPPQTAAVRRGDEALAAHRLERFDEAIAAYTEALSRHPDDPHILSSLSRVYAVWCAWLQFSVRDLRAGGQAPPAQLEALVAQTRPLIEQAKRYGERAAQRNPGNEEASVALSDALRLSGNLVAARAELDRARATQGVESAETLRVAAMLAIDENDSEVHTGRKFAEKAVEQEPTLIRARLLLARCLLDDNDPAAAEVQLAAVRQLDPNHPLIAEIAAQIARKASAQATPGVARAEDAGVTARAVVATTPATPSSANRPAARAANDTDTSDPDELVRRGEAALERGSVQQAERAFERALAIDPHMASARTGLGYVALERNQPVIAIAQFRQAAAREHADALIGLGDAYRKLGRTRDALDAYRSYLRRFPKGDRRSIAQHQSELLSEQLENQR